MNNTKTPLSYSLECDRISLGQDRTPAYGDALKLLQQTEIALKVTKINLQNREEQLKKVIAMAEMYSYDLYLSSNMDTLTRNLRNELDQIKSTLNTSS
ncbi:MAG: hypothetical protein EB127_25850 [Alphaproteobacteria bacterium]|nr:hypothetical protein [Alphaproteobacteria bacterium]